MPGKESTKSKHLTQEERQEIQDCLKHGMSFKDIGRRIGKDQTTISKEIKKHVVVRPSAGRRVSEEGTSIPKTICPLLLKAPFVCNPCQKYHGSCGFDRQVYVAKKAQESYKELLREARTGIPLNKEEFYRTDRIIADGVKRGQHLYHILHSHDLGVSKSTVYRHLKLGYLSISTLDMPRVLKFKPRARRHTPCIPKALKVGRAHADFLTYTQQNNITQWVEMDTVIGRIGGKTILTLHFTSCNFMVGLLLENKTSSEVTRAIKTLKQRLGSIGSRFGDIFPVILTDNGGEFADIFSIENDLNGKQETRLFFCDPYQSSQKPRVEKNHTLFRDIVPSGSSFDSFTQETVNTIFSHVNSVKRHGMTGRTACEMFSFLFGDILPTLLGIVPIPSHAVCQSPLLLKV